MTPAGSCLDAQIPHMPVKALSGHEKDVFKQSYGTNTPVGPALHLAGHPAADMETYAPAHLVLEAVTPELVELGMPELLAKRANVDTAISKISTSKEMMAERLYSARGSSKIIVNAIKVALCAAAARARTAEGLIDFDSQPLYLRFSAKKTLFRLAPTVWESPAFLQLVAQVKASEEMERGMSRAEVRAMHFDCAFAWQVLRRVQ